MVTSPRPVAEELVKFYPEEDYYAYRIGAQREPRLETWLKRLVRESFYGYPPLADSRPPRLWWRWLLWPLRSRLRHIPPYVPGGRLLDVGCGAGDYLDVVSSLGWEPYGVDINSKAIEICQTRMPRGQFFLGHLDNARFPDDFFDVVNLSHVLEHMDSPTKTLQEVWRILKQEGLVLIHVPNADGMHARLFRENWFPWELPRHLVHFSPATIKVLVSKVGFEQIEILFHPTAYALLCSLKYQFEAWFSRRILFEEKKWLSALLYLYGTLLAGLAVADNMQVCARKPVPPGSKPGRNGNCASLP